MYEYDLRSCPSIPDTPGTLAVSQGTPDLCLDGLFGLLGTLLDLLLDVLEPAAQGVLGFPSAEFPVIEPSSLLHKLSSEVGGVTSEQQVVSGLDPPREPHEHGPTTVQHGANNLQRTD